MWNAECGMRNCNDFAPRIQLSGERISDGYISRRRIVARRRTLPRRIPHSALRIPHFSEQLVLLELLAQGIAVDAEDFRGPALVTLDVTHDGFEQRLFHLADHHVVHARGLLAVEVVEIALHGLFYARRQRRLAVFGHAASSRTWASKNSRTRDSCTAQVSAWLTRWRNAAPLRRPLLYQEMCLRAMRTPLYSP